MWLSRLKIAIVEKNTDNLDDLLDDIPKLQSKQDIEEAIYLLREASQLVHSLKDETAHSMNQIQKNLKFLRSTEALEPNSLDIKS